MCQKLEKVDHELQRRYMSIFLIRQIDQELQGGCISKFLFELSSNLTEIDQELQGGYMSIFPIRYVLKACQWS